MKGNVWNIGPLKEIRVPLHSFSAFVFVFSNVLPFLPNPDFLSPVSESVPIRPHEIDSIESVKRAKAPGYASNGRARS